MTNIITKESEMNCYPLNLDLGQGLSVPRDIAMIIFQNSKANLHNMSSVSKKWKAFADDEQLREWIRPVQAFGTNEWKEFIGVDAGVELPLPRWVYKFMREDGYMLTFIPEIVRVAKENGIIEEVALDNLESIGRLVANPKNGRKIGISHGDWNSWEKIIKEKRKLEKAHWVLICKKAMGRNQNYIEQQATAKKDGNISGLIDTTTSVFMEYIRSGKRNFIWDSSDIEGQRTMVRVNEKTDNLRISLGFVPSGLFVCSEYGDNAYDGITFTRSRRSLEH